MLSGIFGGLGDGKTLLLTILTKQIVRRVDYEVYANYNIKDDRIKQITPIDLLDINPATKRALIDLDEAYAWLESRISSFSKLNRIISYILFQSRKRNMDICYTAQLMSSVDVRLRSLTDRAWVCEKEKAGFRYKVYWQKGLRIHKRKLFLPLSNAKKYYDAYDTREIIKPYDMDKLRQELIEEQENFDLNKEIETCTSKIIPLIKDMKITRSTVEFLLLKMGKPLKYAGLIQTQLLYPNFYPVQKLEKPKGDQKTWQII